MVDICWKIVSPTQIPVHHQYHLFSAISKIIPDVHHLPHFGVHQIKGVKGTPGFLDLMPYSTVTIRTDPDQLKTVLPLTGKKLNLGDSFIRLGIPCIRPLLPVPTLFCPLVTVKDCVEDNQILASIQRKLSKIEVAADIEICRRKVLRIKQCFIVGFAVRLAKLNEQDSLKILTVGLGGRRHMGCGLFYPEAKS